MKTYITPDFKIFEIENETIISASTNISGDSAGSHFDPTKTEGMDDNAGGASSTYRNNLWD